MVNFIYDNQLFVIDEFESIQSMLSREDLLNLPLEAWKELFIQKDGTCLLQLMYLVLEKKIKAYDKMANAVIYKDKKYKIDKLTRVSLGMLLNSNPDEFNLVLGDNLISMEPQKAKEFLKNLEMISAKCFQVTHQHLNKIKKLKTLEEIINYPYTEKYPDNIILE